MADKNIDESGIFSSLFKSKETYQDKMNKKLGSYAPVPSDSYSGSGKGFDPDLASRDEGEARKRLISALGMAMGAGSVKSMANRALKTFPIIVSDDTSADTAVMIKRALEEQYAEYINLIVSNQVVDISDLKPTSVGGNMAMQALDRLTGPEFGTKRIAAKAATGDLSTDDVMSNSAAYALLRKESAMPTTGDEYADSLLEGAIITSNADEESVAEKLILSEALSKDDKDSLVAEAKRLDGNAFDVIKYYRKNSKVVKMIGSMSDSERKSAVRALDAETDGAIDKADDIFKSAREMTYGDAYSDHDISSAVSKLISDAGMMQNTLTSIKAIVSTTMSEASYPAVIPSERSGGSVPPSGGASFKASAAAASDPEAALTALFNGLEGLADGVSDDINTLRTVIARAEVSSEEADDESGARDTDSAIPDSMKGEKEDSDVLGSLENMTNLKFDPNKLKVSMNDDNTTIGKVIANNPFLRDRYEKASYLLVSNRISGNEFISYCVVRLGIPMSRSTRAQLVMQFKSSDIITGSYGTKTVTHKSGDVDMTEFGLVDKDTANNIARNKLIYTRAMTETFRLTTKQAWQIAGVGAAGATASGLAGWGIGAAAGASAAALPWAIALPAVIGGAASAAAMYAIIRNKWDSMPHSSTVHDDIEGWERVETLINQMDKNRKQLWDLDQEYAYNTGYHMDKNGVIDYKGGKDSNAAYQKDKYASEAKALKDAQDDFFKSVKGLYNVTPAYTRPVRNEEYSMHEATLPHAKAYNKSLCEDISKSLKGCREYIVESALLNERVLNTNIRHNTYTYNVNPTDQDVSLVPEFGSKGLLAYGSVEYDKKDLRDRRYNDPLVMTVKFNSRFNDGRTSDSSLTAVIGILGVITRVPSAEMEYVLKMNSDKNKAVKGVFSSDDAKLGNPIADAISGAFKDADDSAKNLPNSGDLWNNLEKLSNIAVANKLAGKQLDNVINAHIVFSHKEVEACKQETGDDYAKDVKLAIKLMRRYSALSVMIADDDLYGDGTLMICDDPDAISWDVVPYSAFENRSIDDRTTKQLSAIAKLAR
jgi:hypothetical protein